jgi:hypothetical protein
MSNTLLTISDITNESLMILENELVLADKVNREYDDKFGIDGAKIGYTINVRMPARFVGTAGPALNVEDFVENSRAVTLTNQFHVDTQFITSDLLLSMDMFSKRVLKPKIATIANKVDNDLANYMRWNTAASVGTAGTRPTTTSPFLSAGAILDTEAVPRDGDRCMVLDPFSQASMVGGLQGLFNPQAQLADQYKKGQMSKDTLGFNWYMDQNISSQVNKVLAGTPVYTTTGTSSAVKTSGWADTGTLQTSGWSNSTAVLNVGDVFSIANVFMVNPQARQATTQLRYFVVMPFVGTPSAGTFVATTDVFGNTNGGTYTSSGSGTLQIQIAECIISAGQFQNVNAAPANSAAITLYSTTAQTSAQSLAFHKNAYTLVSADLPLPGGVDMAARASHKDVGFSMRVVRQYTINNDALPTRIDVLYGMAPLYRSFACRVHG